MARSLDDPSLRVSDVTPVDGYTHRLPSPPPILIPSFGDVRRRNIGLDFGLPEHTWTYSDRHEAQAILPRLFLGPASVARDREFLSKNGITLVVIIRQQRVKDVATTIVPASQRVPNELGIETKLINVDSTQSLARQFPTTSLMLDNGYSHAHGTTASDSATQGKILVVCDTGNGRSAAVVIAYLMARQKLSLVTAVQYLQSRRFSISLDEQTRIALSAYEGIVEAHSQIQTAATLESASQNDMQNSQSGNASLASASSLETRQRRAKRSRSDDDDDMEMSDGDADSQKNAVPNRAFAPFVSNG